MAIDYPNLPTFAERFRWARKTLRNLTQEQLAEQSGVDRYVITRIELGQTNMPRQFSELAEVLGVSAAWLLFGFEELEALDKEAIDLAVAWKSIPDDDPQKQAYRTLILNAYKTKPE